ncbi:MAG: 4-hydroxy-3-methylbut-2-enyl diphosphate reductase [Candidatus Omnitrophica bacterium]|nr:4-hydroxy-3-methylbut-2-enyl diphosphate reductase [Candidatus Omnitrophota bacterium]
MPDNSQIIRKSFGLKEQVRPALEANYHSSLVDRIKSEGYRLERGRLTIYLAEEFGFCYGVDRAIDYAYETKAKFPDKNIYLTNEIIHNPQVNAKLRELGVQFLSGPYSSGKTLQHVEEGDVVIIPAFGTTITELDELQRRGAILVDTTCGSVMSVWKRVESYAREGFTSIIHGKYDHEETCATSSRAMQYPGGKYLIVRDKSQAKMVCDYIEGRGNRESFIREFQNAVSAGFDLDADLGRIGCANQTTMLSSESLEIANMLQESLGKRYGVEELPKRFRHFDTICSATQDRQDAVLKLARRQAVDIMIVVGGYNSSNTGHLVEISLEFCPAFHIRDAECIISKNKIRHKKVFNSEIIETDNWLPEGPVKIGVTAGASTPNRVIEEVIERILKIA